VTQADSNGSVTPRRRWTRIALLISVALNVLFLGVVVGAGWIHWRDDGRGRSFSFSRGVDQLIKGMPADRKPIAQSALDRYRNDVRPQWREVGEARRAAFEALRAEPFNEEQVKAAFDRLDALRESQRKLMGTITFDLMRQLTPEERRTFLQALRQRRPPPPPRPDEAKPSRP